jgi:hypothetical protein
MDTTPLSAPAFKRPAILLSGLIDQNMYWGFRPQFDHASKQDLVVIELSTLGGDPEVARLMGGDIRFLTQIMPDRRFVFLGKAGSPGRRAARVSRERTRMPDRLAACSRATDQSGELLTVLGWRTRAQPLSVPPQPESRGSGLLTDWRVPA